MSAEPEECVFNADGDCIRVTTECTCVDYCGESDEAGCCFCRHRDIYEPCPRGGFWCDPCQYADDEEPCCTPEQRRFVAKARLRLVSSANRGAATEEKPQVITKAQAAELRRLIGQTGPIWDTERLIVFIDSLTERADPDDALMESSGHGEGKNPSSERVDTGHWCEGEGCAICEAQDREGADTGDPESLVDRARRLWPEESPWGDDPGDENGHYRTIPDRQNEEN